MPEETTEEVEETIIEGGEDNSAEIKNEEETDKEAGAESKEEEPSDNEGEKEFEDDGEDPVVRKKTNADWVAERRGKKIEKMKNQQKDKPEEEDIKEEEEEDVDEDDERIVRKVIEKELGPVLNPILAEKSKAEDDIEIGKVLTKFPELKVYEAKVRRYMAYPSRQNLPVETIFAEVAGVETLLKLGAKKGIAAEEKAAEGRSGGGSGSTAKASKAEEIRNMTSEQFEAYKAEKFRS